MIMNDSFGFICPECKLSFVDAESLSNHFESVHEKAILFNQTTSASTTLIDHLPIVQSTKQNLVNDLENKLSLLKQEFEANENNLKNALNYIKEELNSRIIELNKLKQENNNLRQALINNNDASSPKIDYFCNERNAKIESILNSIKHLRKVQDSLFGEIISIETDFTNFTVKLDQSNIKNRSEINLLFRERSQLAETNQKYQNQINTLKEQIEELNHFRNENQKCIDKINRINQINLDLAESVESLKSELSSKQNIILELTEFKNKYDEKRSFYESELIAKNIQIDQIKDEICVLQNKYDSEMKAESEKEKSFHRTIASQQTLLNDNDNQIRQLTIQVDTLTKKCLDLTQSQLNYEKLYNQSVASYKELENANISFSEKINELERKLDNEENKCMKSLLAISELGDINIQLQKTVSMLKGKQWKDENEVKNCEKCRKEFTITIRKHHCRLCGGVFCSDCSSDRVQLPSQKSPSRVCNSCFCEYNKTNING